MSNLDSLIARGKRCQTRLLRARLSNQMRAVLHAQRALDRKRRKQHLSKELRALRAMLAEIGPPP